MEASVFFDTPKIKSQRKEKIPKNEEEKFLKRKKHSRQKNSKNKRKKQSTSSISLPEFEKIEKENVSLLFDNIFLRKKEKIKKEKKNS